MTNYPLHIRKKLLFSGGKLHKVKEVLRRYELNTVCESARCPNRGECFHSGVATFLILGDICTRHCRFCGVKKGIPLSVDETEAERIALAAGELGLQHIVITSVTRDDLEDGGAKEFARTIRAIRRHLPYATVEVLTPDFKGSTEALQLVLKEKPEVFNHNLETVPRLAPEIRPQADYQRSLWILQKAKELSDNDIITKSGIMVGIGETADEVVAVMRDLRAVNCDVLTIGQYLSPGTSQIAVKEFILPEQFIYYRRTGLQMGFKAVLADTFVRSSFQSAALVQQLRKRVDAIPLSSAI
ncbi:MAG: lipoyl synthase [Candidatus Sumerlaeia bacterium]|nr:lipoyl synthase [Candidatus Sumerlaeia bacterium]